MSVYHIGRKWSSSCKRRAVCIKTHIHPCVPPPRLFWEVIWARYCVLMGSYCIIFARAVHYPGSNCSAPRRNEHHSSTCFFNQAECPASSPVKAQLWYSHSAFKTSNPTHHKLSLQAFMADSKHMLIRELHPASSANGAVFLIKSMAYHGT